MWLISLKQNPEDGLLLLRGGTDHCKRFLFLTYTVKFTFRNFEAICKLPIIQDNDYPPDPSLGFEGYHLKPIPDLVESKTKHGSPLQPLSHLVVLIGMSLVIGTLTFFFSSFFLFFFLIYLFIYLFETKRVRTLQWWGGIQGEGEADSP